MPPKCRKSEPLDSEKAAAFSPSGSSSVTRGSHSSRKGRLNIPGSREGDWKSSRIGCGSLDIQSSSSACRGLRGNIIFFSQRRRRRAVSVTFDITGTKNCRIRNRETYTKPLRSIHNFRDVRFTFRAPNHVTIIPKPQSSSGRRENRSSNFELKRCRL